ncbi:hypothetical protein GE061_004518 [Apolygus lucorum]|uniref:C2H2-type domain-containing protein n=1 Tax=Apolygus lucorum TaxID=248454 RepID=A0A8S9WYX6_APOLU|nr:hypothetical protein GE061_004518 [Apolygus lucorum]
MQRPNYGKMYNRGGFGQYPQRFSRRDLYQSDCEAGQSTSFRRSRSRSNSRCQDPQQGGNNNFIRHNRSSSLNRFQNLQQGQGMMFTKRGTGRGYSRQNSYRFSQMGYNSDCEDTQNTNFGMRNMRNTPRFSNVQKQRMNVRAKYNQRGHSNVACYSGRTNKFDNHGQEPYQDCHGHQEPAMDCQDNQNSEISSSAGKMNITQMIMATHNWTKIIRMHHSGVFSVSSKNKPQSPDRDCLPKQEENGMSSSDNKIHAQQDSNDKLWVVDELVFAAIRENYQEDQWETARLAFGQINDMAFKKISTYHCEYCSIRCRTEQDIINHKKTKHHISKREIFFKEWIKTLSLVEGTEYGRLCTGGEYSVEYWLKDISGAMPRLVKNLE